MPRRPSRGIALPVPATAAVLAVVLARRGPLPLMALAAGWLLAQRPRPTAAPGPSEAEALRRELHDFAARCAAEAEAQARASSRLRHDVRGALAPVLLVADRLTMAEEPDKRRAGELISRAVGRAVELLRKPPDP